MRLRAGKSGASSSCSAVHADPCSLGGSCGVGTTADLSAAPDANRPGLWECLEAAGRASRRNWWWGRSRGSNGVSCGQRIMEVRGGLCSVRRPRPRRRQIGTRILQPCRPLEQ